MPNRTRRQVWSGFRAVIAAATLLVAARAPAAPPSTGEGAAASALEDEAHLLTDHERAALARLLRTKAAESGSPLSVLLIARLARHEAIDDVARRAFAARTLDRPGPPRVLLVVAAREHEVAIETGRGPAGIVPEIDARRIIQRLQSALAHHRPSRGLEEAVVAIAASARATADRRRPLPPDPPEGDRPRPLSAPAEATEPGPDGAGVEAKPDVAPPRPAQPTRRSLMPAAYLLAGIAVLALALRRRRRLAQDRDTGPKRPPPERKPGKDVKSIGDRPMS